MKVRCNVCGNVVSNEIPENTIIRAWVECPECAENNKSNTIKKIINIGKDHFPNK